MMFFTVPSSIALYSLHNHEPQNQVALTLTVHFTTANQ